MVVERLFKNQPSCEARKRRKTICVLSRGGCLYFVSDDVNCGFPHMKKVASAGSGIYNQVKQPNLTTFIMTTYIKYMKYLAGLRNIFVTHYHSM